jgi:hypothetical protein
MVVVYTRPTQYNTASETVTTSESEPPKVEEKYVTLTLWISNECDERGTRNYGRSQPCLNSYR